MSDTSPDPLWTKASVIEFLKEEKAKITPAIIKDLITNNEAKREDLIELYKEFTGESLKIWDKTAVKDRPNNKLAHDFRGEIVEQKVGYSFGNPISYKLSEEPYSEKVYQDISERLNDFQKENKLRYLDSETAKYASICGFSARLLYLNKNKDLRVMHVEPWEAIFIKDQSLDQVVYAIRFYEMTEVDDEDEKERKYYYVEFYDSKKVYYFVQNKEKNFIYDPDKPAEAHGFNKVPLIEFPNKAERQGDFQKVRSLIDAYDFIDSFNQDELESFRNAYLMFKGVIISPEFMEKLRQTGGIELPGKDSDAAFLTKNINDTFIDNHMRRLKESIYRFAKTVDMSDEKFSGSAQSGESRKWKLKALGDDALLKEASFVKSSIEMFEVISTLWAKYRVKFDPNDISIQFTQNAPVDYLYHADVSTKLKGLVSEKTRLSLLPFIEDPEKEIDQMNEENEAYMQFDQVDNDQNDEDNEEDGNSDSDQ